MRRRAQPQAAEADAFRRGERRLQDREGLPASLARQDVVRVRERDRVEGLGTHELQDLEDVRLHVFPEVRRALSTSSFSTSAHFPLDTSYPRTTSSSGTSRPSLLQNLRYSIGALSFRWRRWKPMCSFASIAGTSWMGIPTSPNDRRPFQTAVPRATRPPRRSGPDAVGHRDDRHPGRRDAERGNDRRERHPRAAATARTHDRP